MLRSGKMYQPNSISEKETFEVWKERVDKMVFSKLNIHCYDLPDEDYWMNWDNNVDSQQMANYVIQNTYDMLEHFSKVAKN